MINNEFIYKLLYQVIHQNGFKKTNKKTRYLEHFEGKNGCKKLLKTTFLMITRVKIYIFENSDFAG